MKSYEIKAGDRCTVNGSGDLMMDREDGHLIGKDCVIVKRCKSGLYLVALEDDLKYQRPIPLRNIDPPKVVTREEILAGRRAVQRMAGMAQLLAVVIADKEEFLANFDKMRTLNPEKDTAAHVTTSRMLKLNIKELKLIHYDLVN